MGYHLPEAAHRDLKALEKRLLTLVGSRVLTAAQAKEQYFREVRKLYASAITDDGQVHMPIKCNGCGDITVVARDVQRYKCHCSPNVERYTAHSRQIDIPIGTGRITDLLTP